MPRSPHDHDCVARGCEYVDGEDLKLFVRLAKGIVKRRRLRRQSRVYDDPIDLVEAVARKYERGE